MQRLYWNLGKSELNNMLLEKYKYWIFFEFEY